MVPNGWKIIPIKDACEAIIDCVNKTAPVVDYKTNFKMLRTTNVRNGRVNTQDVRYVTEETYLQWVKRGKPKRGDIIFTREAPVGEAGILEEDNGVFLGQRTMMYRANNDLADNYYLFYSLSSEYCQKQIDNFSNGGTVAHMRVPDCGEILINLPPLIEQKKIAQILSTWDKAIATTEQLLTISQQQKKALMQKLLTGKRRFSEFKGDWKSVELGSLLEYKQPTPYLVKSTDYNNDYETPVLTAGKTFILGYTNEPEGIYKDKLPVIIFDDFTTDSKFVDFPFKAKSSAMKILTAREGISIKYVFEAMQMLDFTIGGHQRHWISIFSNLKIAIPEIAEQQKIASVLSTADSEIKTLKQQLNRLEQEKKALMQQLLTGKRRVRMEAE
ncbi:type I restriction-modification system, specificity subunit S [Tatumella ptyseos ATCC 33301]|uniref:Type I restriction-modification system, specificity subunit S n=2 Tax=Tatumella ptyseos TaxID=82987 RepID=A0A085JQ25_9GAMM|nr:restriction endonuclease subunit S [Tatumella ptyseos]KFD22571.1 type I restriction-modification system, specificity subunit S [Tatumella ptyseos ATCC 33301]SQK72143.1 Type I restriction enzyme EcoKI specificity protein [Tatumella ptyseos]